MKDILRRVSFSRFPPPQIKPWIARSRLLPPLPLNKRPAKPWASGVALSGIPGKIHVQWVTDLQSGRGSCPEFNQHWKILKRQGGKKQRENFCDTFAGSLGEVTETKLHHQHHQYYLGVQEHIFSQRWSYLWHPVRLSTILLMASTVGRQFKRVVFQVGVSKRQTKEPTRFTSVREKVVTNK